MFMSRCWALTSSLSDRHVADAECVHESDDRFVRKLAALSSS